MERLIFIDSNIWCYYSDRSRSGARSRFRRRRGWKKSLEDRVAINTVIEMEVGHCLIKNLGLEGKIDTFSSYPTVVVNFDQHLARKSIEYLTRYSQTGIGGRGATILASMKELKIDTLMTPRSGFQKNRFH